MLRNYSQIALIFTAMFVLLTLILKPFQLMGITDQGYWINFFYNFINLGEPKSLLIKSHFFEHSLLFLISPLAYIKNPIFLSYVLYYLTYLSWFLTFYLLSFGKFELKKVCQSFLLFFCSTTLFFHYGLNFNGWNSIYIAPALMALSYYFSFIKANYKKSILSFLPLLLLKIQFWLLLPFLLLSIYVHSKKKRYLVCTLISLIGFFFYLLKIRLALYDNSFTGSPLLSAYGHLNINDLNNFLQIFFNNIGLKLSLIIAFFFQFLFLIDLKAIKKKDLLIYFLLIFPIFSYCILSSRTVMSYWTHEHYVLPVLPVILLILLKYSSFSKIRILFYILINLILICGILSMKEPWQYKYYQDESQLENQIKPLMTLNYDDYILVDDRTGLYFANHQINFPKFIKDKTRDPKYIVLNLRYIFYTNNIKRHKSKEVISSFKFLKDYEKDLNEYGILYQNYPFVVYEKKLKGNIDINPEVMKDWDLISIQDNRIF